MKKILNIILIIITFTAINVSAAGSVTVSPGNMNLQPGGSKTLTITAVNAAGRIDISSSNTKVATVSLASQWIENGSINVTVKAVGEGTAQIIVKLTDVATFDGDVLTGNKIINVTSKKAVADQTDAFLSNITIEGYEIDFSKNKLDYSIDVPNNVTSLKISAKTSSSAASLVISGGDKLELGNNKVTIIVTAGNGTKKEYIINVNRKDDIPEATLNNLKEVINNTTKDTIAIKLTDDTIITNEIISIIKNNNKNVVINKYNDDGNMIYSYILNKEVIASQETFDATVGFSPTNIEEIQKATNYSEGIYLQLGTSKLNGGQLRVYVADKYLNDQEINVLTFKDKQINVYQEKLKVEKGYVTFDLSENEQYVLTRAVLDSNNKATTKKGINTFAVISAVELVALIGLSAFTTIKLKKKTR